MAMQSRERRICRFYTGTKALLPDVGIHNTACCTVPYRTVSLKHPRILVTVQSGGGVGGVGGATTHGLGDAPGGWLMACALQHKRCHTHIIMILAAIVF